jgi:hypothetical protein
MFPGVLSLLVIKCHSFCYFWCSLRVDKKQLCNKSTTEEIELLVTLCRRKYIHLPAISILNRQSNNKNEHNWMKTSINKCPCPVLQRPLFNCAFFNYLSTKGTPLCVTLNSSLQCNITH